MTDQTAPSPAPTILTILREFGLFLRRPAILDPQGWGHGGAKRWAVLTVVLIAGLMAVLLPFLGAWQKAWGLPSPTAFDAFPRAWLIPVTVIVAPVAEELLFRGWQRGSAAALWLLGCALVGAAVLTRMTDPAQALPAASALVLAAAAMPIGWLMLRRRPAPLRWFSRAFPWIFYAVAIGFALFHLTNYPQVTPLMLPLVLPQLWGALVLGYMRQRLGLMQAILTHVAANGCSIALALATGSIGT